MSRCAYTRHPLPITVLNALRPVLDAAHVLPRLDADALVAAARKKTGLTDFGDEWFREPLSVLIRSINGEADLSALGRLIMHRRIRDALIIRLRAEALFKAHPAILDIDLGHVFVIAGLQRTGTTLLHRLLASDPRMRAPFSWEALNPVPFPAEQSPAARMREAQRARSALKYIAPGFFAIHPIEVDLPEEDILFLDLSFMSQSFEATMRVPGYARWLEDANPVEAYRYLRKMMQLLHWQNAGAHTVLKSPHHMEYLETVLQVFPGATIIQTHRDPARTMPSFASMVCHGAGIFSDKVDVTALAAHWRRKVRRMIDRSIAVRDAMPDACFTDIAYADLVADPLGTLRRLYAGAGLGFDAQAEANARALLDRQVRNKYGRHHYQPEDFGMTRADIDRDFGFYRDRYDIPVEAQGGPP